MIADDKPADIPAPATTDERTLSQEELQERYIEQQRRMSCPGCGEAQQIF